MRSWKTPALLATIGLCGLGSLFAQGPVLPSYNEPTLVSPAPAPAADTPVSGSNYSEVVAPSPVTESVEQPAVPVYESAPVISEVPASGGGIEVHSVPASSSGGYPTEYVAPPVESTVISSDPVMTGPAFAQPACNCQGNSAVVSGSAYGAPVMGGDYGSYGHFSPPPSTGPIYTMGSGSGVAAGVLTPNSNSGGLHTRYPYYSYRAPWYYQGPPSLNVTIVW